MNTPGKGTEPALASRRIVIKVGSSVLTAPDEQGVNRRVLGGIASQVAELRRAGREVVLVSSGAIAAGSKRMGVQGAPKEMPERQAAAAVGQPILMEAYGRAFRRRAVETAQLLLTHADLDQRTRFLNACNTFEALLARGVLPIVNENDTVSVEEIRFGDNDTLAALVAQMVNAGLVIILSDVEGLYDADPRRHPSAKLIRRVEGLPAEIEGRAGTSANPLAHGGMVTKVRAVKVLNRMGIATLIVRGRTPKILLRALERGGEGTLFVPNGVRLGARKGWIGTAVIPRGWIRLDAGAVTALAERGRSLLPRGVVEAGGEFRFGDVVELRDPKGRAVARGLANYGVDDVNRIAGKHTGEIAGILGGKDYDEVVHRNNLVLLD
ncbi:MAG: glutamate 5-kinase [Candidatus Tectomicrobia bacterium RIFCSPLOWO2_12_FULL_69_37]|nr:MAG: glutamate 5-kinase [Candidatus Tectomicrobia bacterium RIFCSPLOWO2_02_FULL_70_19]OGL63668.1 MAG: glutamate 5-kinase [Candidatus Tectomicrobia bacterium RIFCSPLOWO2_12_FULL_69_37]